MSGYNPEGVPGGQRGGIPPALADWLARTRAGVESLIADPGGAWERLKPYQKLQMLAMAPGPQSGILGGIGDAWEMAADPEARTWENLAGLGLGFIPGRRLEKLGKLGVLDQGGVEHITKELYKGDPFELRKIGMLHHPAEQLRAAGAKADPNLPIVWGRRGGTHATGSRLVKDSFEPEEVAEMWANALGQGSTLRADPASVGKAGAGVRATPPGSLIASNRIGGVDYEAYLEPRLSGGKQVAWETYKVVPEGKPGRGYRAGDTPYLEAGAAAKRAPRLNPVTGLPQKQLRLSAEQLREQQLRERLKRQRQGR